MTLLQINILLFVSWHFDFDFTAFNKRFNFNTYRFIDWYVLIDSLETNS